MKENDMETTSERSYRRVHQRMTIRAVELMLFQHSVLRLLARDIPNEHTITIDTTREQLGRKRINTEKLGD